MLELRAVTKRHPNGVIAVEELSMEIASHELCVLVGPSGCGKTTTLKMINRLIEPTSGEILLDGVNVLGLNAVELRRGIGYVSQQGGLFPHRRVADNVATIPRLLGWPAERVAARVDELLELVGLDPALYRRRFPHELSGGERQRVGVARALGAEPLVLLMDEPFGAIDPIARKRLQAEFRELHARLGTTVIFVTHDIDEALALGDRIALFERGARIEQYDTPAAILAKPATAFVAEFVGVDRDLQRLGFAELGHEDIEQAGVVGSLASLSECRAALAKFGAHYLVVVDDAGEPSGYLSDADLNSSSDDVAQHPHRFAARLPLGTSLRSALSAMLLEDDPVVAVMSSGAIAGVLTLASLHAAIRCSAAAVVPES